MTGRFPPISEPRVASVASCDVILDCDDPLNPFKHRYHPDHDNRDEFYDPLPEGDEQP